MTSDAIYESYLLKVQVLHVKSWNGFQERVTSLRHSAFRIPSTVLPGGNQSAGHRKKGGHTAAFQPEERGEDQRYSSCALITEPNFVGAARAPFQSGESASETSWASLASAKTSSRMTRSVTS